MSILNVKTRLASKINEVKKRFEKLDAHYRLYWYAAPFAIAGNLTALFPGTTLCTGILYAVAGLIFSLGFLKWILKYFNPLSPGIAARLMINIVHAFVLVLSIALSRNIVSYAIGLPANYFDVTVSMMALISYIPVYISLITVAAIICFVSFLVAAGICLFVQHTLFGNVDVQSWMWRQKGKAWLIATAVKTFWHGIGAMSLAIIGAFAFQSFLYVSMHMNGPIRLFAYGADFQPPRNYPCISPNTRIRLEDNGIVAVASFEKFEVSISNKVYTSPTSSTLECLAK